MRKRVTLLISALMLALTMSFGGVAFADGHGCKGGSTGFQHSNGQCHHGGNKGNHNGNGGDDHEGGSGGDVPNF
jgi:Spy/CpxP family protein refolding chaperone